MIENFNKNDAKNLRNDLKEELNKDKLDVYFHFDIENESDPYLAENTSGILCSILTDGIMEYDDIYFNNERELDFNEYRVHFELFQISDPNSIRRIEKYISIDKWYKGTIYKNKENKDNYNINFIYSLSPIVIEKRSLQFNGKEVDEEIINKINKVYNCDIETNKTINIEKYVDCKNNINDIRINVYKVGDGNCNYIYIGKSRVLYDIGYNIHSWPKQNINECIYKPYVCASRRFKPSIVIISHWDLDHFIGCAYANKALFEVPWIVKESNDKIAVSAQRLIKYLYIKGILYFYNNINNNNNNSFIKIHIGKGKDKDVSKANCEGIYVVIEYDGKKALLTGDVPYKCMNHESDIIFMVAPHHGGKMEYIDDFFNNCNRDKVKKIAIFSTNGENKNRPDVGHKNYLLDNGFKTDITESAKGKGFQYSLKHEKMKQF